MKGGYPMKDYLLFTLFLVPILPQFLFSLVRRYFLTLPLSAAGHVYKLLSNGR